MQTKLFDDKKNNWQEEWQDMPEFEQKNCEPVQKITINFKTKEDVKDFAKLTKLKITDKTKTSWFPYREKNNMKKLIFENEK
tara:strand:+ start:130 stop:375 length:246 start_codon:yes stop_codon:yes gene_type:complete